MRGLRSQTPGTVQGLTIILAGYLPILAIVSLFPAVGKIIGHFAPTEPLASTLGPAMVTAPGFGIAIFALFAGILVDRFDRRSMLLAATFMFGAIGIAPIYLSDLETIYASRLLLGLCEAAIIITVNSLVADYWDNSARRRWLAIQGLVGPALASLTILLAGLLAAQSWRSVFWLYMIAFPLLVAIWRFIFEPDCRRRASRDGNVPAASFPVSRIIALAGLNLFSSSIYFVFTVHGSIVWNEIGVADTAIIGRFSFLPSLFVVAGAGLFWLLGTLGGTYRLQAAIFLGLHGIGLFLMGCASAPNGMVAGMILQQTGAGMTLPTLIGWGLNILPPTHRGRGVAVLTGAFFFGQFGSPFVVSLVKAHVSSMQETFVMFGMVALFGTAVLILSRRLKTNVYKCRIFSKFMRQARRPKQLSAPSGT